MGLPNINISFKELALTAKERSARGIVSLVLRDKAALGFTEINEATDLPQDLSEGNKKLVNLALIGNINAPNEVMIYVLNEAGESVNENSDIQSALDYLETKEFNYICMPAATVEEKDIIKAWINKLREVDRVKVKAVLANMNADYEGVVNFTSDSIKLEGESFDTGAFTARVSGLIAGTPLSQSITYTKLDEVVDIPKMTRQEAEEKIDSGELILIKEAGAIRIARGVNSLKSTTPNKGEIFQKIKIVDTLDIIHNDIKKVIIDEYIGRVTNNYDNKCLLVVAIKEYLEELEKEQLLMPSSIVDIDMEAQKAYLKSKDINISNMSDQEIKEANTGSNVFLKAKIKALDAMEDVDLAIEI